MPKTNDATGATYAGNEGIVQHGAPIEGGRIFSELDPERNLDGTLIEGDHPDHADGEERDYVATSDPRPLADEPRDDRGDDEEQDTGERSAPTGGKFAAQDDSSAAATPTTRPTPASTRKK